MRGVSWTRWALGAAAIAAAALGGLYYEATPRLAGALLPLLALALGGVALALPLRGERPA